GLYGEKDEPGEPDEPQGRAEAGPARQRRARASLGAHGEGRVVLGRPAALQPVAPTLPSSLRRPAGAPARALGRDHRL
ncbi:MAG: Multicopper oxidase, partial [uncultured Rubrobacteraceae bacterium]